MIRGLIVALCASAAAGAPRTPRPRRHRGIKLATIRVLLRVPTQVKFEQNRKKKLGKKDGADLSLLMEGLGTGGKKKK